MRPRLIIPLLSVLWLLAACGDGATTDAGGPAPDETSGDETIDDGSPRPPVDLDLLRSGTWTLWAGGGPSGEVPIVDGWPITITFGDDTLGGSAACNDYGARYQLDDRRLTIDGLGQNEAACDEPVMASERAFLDALLDVDGIDLLGERGRDGPELALSGMATELLFSFTPAAPTADMAGRLWLLEALLQDGEETAPQGEPATLRLDPDGGLAGSTGCRTLVGRYQVTGSEVQFNEFGADGDCPASLRGQDGLIINVLGDGFTPTLDGDTLVLESAGNEGLRYRAITDDELEEVPSVPVQSDAEALAGVDWVFVGGDGPDGPIADPRSVDPAAEITLVFDGGTYGGNAICNSYSGEVEIGDGGRFALGPARSTRASCGPNLDPIAATYLSALERMIEGGVEADDGVGAVRLVMNDGDATELHWERVG